ncbi:MAG: CBS domain-containing protein [Candidatus Micrarchaeota archaeon]
MNGEMKVRDIMRKDFIYLDEEEKLDAIIEKFAKYGIHEAPVLSRGELRGLVSDREIADALLKKRALPFLRGRELLSAEKAKNIRARDILNRHFLTLEPGMELVDAIIDMARRETNVIPVVEGGRVLGIVTGKDVVGYVAKKFISHEAEEKGGEGLQSAVDAVLALVKERKKVSAEEASKKLGISRERVEAIAKSLAKHGLVEVRYTIGGRMEVRGI